MAKSASRQFCLTALASVLLAAHAAHAQSADQPLINLATPDWFNIHAQDTEIEQFHPAFTSPTRGTNSLDPGARGDETTTVTIYLGARLAEGWSVYADPEMDEGYGLSNTTGAAGYFNGEGAKVGKTIPYGRLQRLFTRYEIGLSGDAEPVMSDENQVEEARKPNNITITAGKFNVTDVFDNNDFAHDPTSDFMNWSIVDAGAFDYAADAWGYSYGASVEWTQGQNTLRTGVFDLSRIPNGGELYRGFGGFESIAEFEHHFNIGPQNGSIRLLAYNNRGDMANYTDATALGLATQTTPNVALVRHYSNRDGYEINFQQALTSYIGFFLRASASDGHKEAYEYTDIDRSVSGGLAIKGAYWNRANDNVGLAFAVNEISKQAQDYLAAGGLGILVGDGSLTKYAPEQIIETFYNISLPYNMGLTLDNQYIQNPAYNATRGPADVIGARFHVAY